MKEYKIRTKDANGIMEETINIPDNIGGTQTDVITYVKAMVDRFNSTLRLYELPREFVEIIGETGKRYCVMHKINLATVSRGNSLYDIWQCKICYMYHQRHGLNELGNYECLPLQTCRECNKVFKTAKALAKHKEKNRHNPPAWLPDGV